MPLALVVIAAVPLLAFGATNIRLQATVLDDHAATGHYGFMAAFSFTSIAVGLHIVHADAGQTTSAAFTMAQPGNYEVYCSVPGHREAGMTATLTVTDTG